ncbi:hypothetical protein GCM10009757_01590 [Streptomyces cheonanensis]|uniref:Uncharacterized protein n=1 Tax=Streptomyces cheonanensis TaxID=312720 RepID=A0ABP5G7Z7_9ACTN
MRLPPLPARKDDVHVRRRGGPSPVRLLFRRDTCNGMVDPGRQLGSPAHSREQSRAGTGFDSAPEGEAHCGQHR